MSERHSHEHSHAPHDWHSKAYVDDWIKHDATRDEERRPRIRQMVALAALPQSAGISVLDVGAGYGFVTEEVLRAFPAARVTLQDFSEPMRPVHGSGLSEQPSSYFTCSATSLIPPGPTASADHSISLFPPSPFTICATWQRLLRATAALRGYSSRLRRFLIATIFSWSAAPNPI
jgi:hypothetical protein